MCRTCGEAEESSRHVAECGQDGEDWRKLYEKNGKGRSKVKWILKWKEEGHCSLGEKKLSFCVTLSTLRLIKRKRPQNVPPFCPILQDFSRFVSHETQNDPDLSLGVFNKIW